MTQTIESKSSPPPPQTTTCCHSDINSGDLSKLTQDEQPPFITISKYSPEKEGGLHPFNFSGDVASHIKTSKSEKEQEDHYLFDLFGGSVQNTRGSSTD